MEDSQTTAAPPMPTARGTLRKKRFIVLALLGLFIFLFFVVFQTGLKQILPPAEQNVVVAEVGEEKIYQSDVNQELAAYPDLPGVSKEEKNEIILTKLKEDSEILQQAIRDGVIQADSAIYNSPQKDYTKRLQAIEQAKKAQEASATNIEGTVLSIWFNNFYEGPLPATTRQQTALSKLTVIRQDVAGKKITLEQAISRITSDSSLAAIDPAYQDNAALHFAISGPDQPITMSPDFDAMLHDLPVGGVSDVFLGEVVPEGKTQKEGILYMFGVVTKRQTDSN